MTYITLSAVLADYEAQQRLQKRVADVWDAFCTIARGPSVPTPGYPGSTHDAYTRWPDGLPHRPYYGISMIDIPAADVRLESIDPAAGTMEVAYPGDDAWEPQYRNGTGTLPLAWLYSDEWQGALATEMAAAYEKAKRQEQQKAAAMERAQYKRLKEKYGGGA